MPSILALGAMLFLSVALPVAAQPPAVEIDEQNQLDELQDTSDAGEMKTLAVVAGARYDELISDITFLGTAAGKPEIGQMIEGGIAFFTQGKGLEAIDKTRPWGVIVQTDGAQLLPVGCLPVKRLSDLLDVAAGYGIDVKEAEDGIRELAQPNKRSVFVKEDDGWAFIGPSPATLARLPENPQATLEELVSDYDLGLRFSIKQVPEAWRQVAIQWMQLGMQQGLQAQSGGNDERGDMREAMAEAQLEQMKRLMEEVESFTLGWAIDADGGRTYLDLVIQAVPGSRTAQEIAAYAQARTNFAGFYQPDAAATMVFAVQSDPERVQQDLEQMEAMYQSLLQQFDKAIDENENIPADMRDEYKAVARDWYEAFIATLKTGRMDGAATLDLDAESLTFVAGAFVKDTESFERGLKKLDAAARESQHSPGIEWNAASHAGVNFHTLSVPVPEEQEAPRKLLGEAANIAFGIGPEAVYLAGGRDYLDALRRAIDASAAEQEKEVPPFEIVISLQPIVETLAAQAEEGPQKDVAESIAEILGNEAAGGDHLRVVAEVIPHGVRYRYEAEEGAIKALGQVIAEQQRQAQQQANQ